ncbi:MAG: hypothetical protein ACODAU_11695 [Myxococcota bacterium]
MRTLLSLPRVTVEEHAKDLLVFRLVGEGDDSTLDEAFGLIQPLLEERAPVRVIIDGRGFADLSMSARWKLAMRMKENRPLIGRTFIFGLSDAMQFAARVVIRASGRTNVHMVDSEREAHEAAAFHAATPSSRAS